MLQEGFVGEGQIFTLVDRPSPQWTIQKCNQVIHAKPQDFEEIRELSQCEFLAPGMRAR
ncbi:hypothetical protein G6549_03490 [Bacillus sp. MM2020_1]|nr:hypothetical protein [Bacillus sp. MM2020_1]